MADFADVKDPIKPLHDQGSIHTDSEALKQAINDAGIEVQVVNWVYEQVTRQKQTAA